MKNEKKNKFVIGLPAGFYLMSSLDKSKSSSTVGLSSVMAGTILVSIRRTWPSVSRRPLYVSGMYLLGLSSCWTFTTCSDVLLSLNKNLKTFNKKTNQYPIAMYFHYTAALYSWRVSSLLRWVYNMLSYTTRRYEFKRPAARYTT